MPEFPEEPLPTMPTNTLGYYDPAFYANEALIHLRKALGFANTVHLGFDAERRSFGRGDVINIKRPSTFTAQSAPSSAQDMKTESVQIALDQWQEVKFSLTDKELAYTGDQIITDHIAPAAYALADKIDQDGCALIKQIPQSSLTAAPATVENLLDTRRILMTNAVPMSDPSRLSVMVTPVIEQQLLQLSAFSQWQGSGMVGTDAQVTGAIGGRFGYGRIFANQNVPAHTGGTCNDTALLINNAGGYAAGTTTINLDAADSSVTGTLVPGDILTIGGRVYAVTNTTTAVTNAFTGVTITPGLEAAVSDNAVVTANVTSVIGENVAYHRDAFALAMARLPDYSNTGLFGTAALGAQVASVQDPVTGLAMRSRIYYVGNDSAVHVALDVLYGWKVLNPRMATRLRDQS